jgi:thioredoxin 1
VVSADRFESEVLRSDLPVFVDFYATWCQPCRMVAPIVEQLAKDLAGKMKFVKVDGDQSPELIESHGVQGYPTMVVFRDGREAARIVGAAPRDSLLKAIRSILG